MYDTLSLRQLEAANLPLDWMTIYVGVRGIELGVFDRLAHLRMKEAQAFALDRLVGAVGTPDEYDIYRVADGASLPHSSDAEDSLRALAGRTGISPDLARRKWRYAVITEALMRISPDAPYTEPNTEPWERWYGVSDALCDVCREWGDVSPENLPPHCEVLVADNAENEWNQTIATYNEWRESEYAAIRAEAERSTI